MSETEVEIKKAKLSEFKDEDTPHCAHWVKRKKRFCKMTLAKNQQYCGEHLPQKEECEGNDDEICDRIICPLDGKHTIYKKNLRKHLKICNAREKDDQPDYIKKSINNEKSDGSSEKNDDLKLSELSDDEFYGTIDLVKRMYRQFIDGQIQVLQFQHKSLSDELANESYGKETKKHLIQSAALLGILENSKQLRNSTSYIEFGAGKGQLAYFLAGILNEFQNSQVILIDRMSLRHKKDNKIEDKSLVHRIRVDIADFNINKLDLLKSTQRNVAISKHLCGGATDLTLRCICNASNETQPTEFVMIALCCHHRCDWSTYVGKDFFQNNNITTRQFTIITKMVSWAICGTEMSRERRRELEEQSLSPREVTDMKSKQRLTCNERETIGYMCKRVLDYGRLQYLRKKGFEAALKFYVSSEVTLENVCLLASKKQ